MHKNKILQHILRPQKVTPAVLCADLSTATNPHAVPWGSLSHGAAGWLLALYST